MATNGDRLALRWPPTPRAPDSTRRPDGCVVVRSVRNDPSLQRSVGTLKEEATAGGATKSSAVFNAVDVLVPKIANVRLLAQPSDTAKVVVTLSKADELVVIGAEQNGFINVQGATGSGWVKVVLVARP